MKAHRHGVSFAIDGSDTTWARLLNVPPSAARGGYVLVTATDAIVRLRSTTTVELVDVPQYSVAAPGEPARIPVGEHGVTIEYRSDGLTTYTHEAGTGLPSLVTVSGSGQGGSVAAGYLPGMAVPAPVERIVWDRRTVPGQLWSGATLTVRVPCGPPGVYEVLRARVFRSADGAAPQATAISSMLIMPRGDTQTRDLAAFTNISTGPSGMTLPYETATLGGAHRRWAPSRDGWMSLRVTLDTTPAADEEWSIWQGYRYVGAPQLAPAGDVVVT